MTEQEINGILQKINEMLPNKQECLEDIHTLLKMAIFLQEFTRECNEDVVEIIIKRDGTKLSRSHFTIQVNGIGRVRFTSLKRIERLQQAVIQHFVEEREIAQKDLQEYAGELNSHRMKIAD